jgi:hypothetical protein
MASRQRSLAPTSPAYLDYNSDLVIAGTPQWQADLYDTTAHFTTTSLSAWQSKTSFDVHTVMTDAGFLNASGTYRLATDFKRTVYPTNGRGGAYSAVMGAYVTGMEQIGYVAQ